MTAQEKKQLEMMACKVRMGVIEGTHSAKAGHPAAACPPRTCSHFSILKS